MQPNGSHGSMALHSNIRSRFLFPYLFDVTQILILRTISAAVPTVIENLQYAWVPDQIGFGTNAAFADRAHLRRLKFRVHIKMARKKLHTKAKHAAQE